MNRRDKLKSSLGSLLRALCDLMILNILWIVCCVPVVTFGPTSSALSRALIRMVQGESTSAVRDFFLSFRRDFGKAVVLGLIGLLGLAVIASDYLFAVSLEGVMRILFLIVAILAGSFVLSYVAYVFPLHAFYENSIIGQIKNAFALAAANPGETLLIWICFAVPVVAFLLLPPVAVAYLGSLYILFGVSAPAYFAAKHQAKVFARFDNAWDIADHQSEE